MEYNILEIWGCGGPSATPLILSETMHTPDKAKIQTIYSPESRALQQCKNEIDMFYQEGKWDDYKKITNPYEYIFLSWNRRSSRSVSTRQPLSRSYFKMIELWKRLELTTRLAPLVERVSSRLKGAILIGEDRALIESALGDSLAATSSPEHFCCPRHDRCTLSACGSPSTSPIFRRASKSCRSPRWCRIVSGRPGFVRTRW